MTQQEILAAQMKELKLTKNQQGYVLRFYNRTNDFKTSLDYVTSIYQVNKGEKKRSFQLVCPPRFKSARGVYKINFDGDKFYIGRSKLIGIRIVQHAKGIREFFETGIIKKNHYLTKLFKYFKQDPLAYYFTVELLDECFTVEELQQKEQKWLNHYKESPNCINQGFISKKVQHEIDDTPDEYKKIIKSRKDARKAYKNLTASEKRILQVKQIEDRGKREIERKRAEEINGEITLPKKTQIAKRFSFNLVEVGSEEGPVLFKLYCGGKYVVLKGQTLGGSIFHLQKACGYFIGHKHDKGSANRNDYYYTFFKYIKDHPGLKFKIEIILISDDGAELLIEEQKELNKAFSDKKCLNGNTKSYINIFNQTTGKHGWLTVKQVEKYYAFMASQVSI